MSRSRLFALLLALILIGIIVNNAWHNVSSKGGDDNLSLVANYGDFTYSLTDTSNNPISSVTLSLKAKPYFDGPVVFWSASGSYTAVIKNSQGVKVATINSAELPSIAGSGNSLVNGSLVTVASITISAGTIQNAYSNWVAGARYSLVVHLTGLSMSLMFNDGAVKAPTSISMPSDVTYTFKYAAPPTVTPTPVPSIIPIPIPTEPPNTQNFNLTPIDDGQWYTDNTWHNAPADNVFLETNPAYQHNGAPTWRIEGGNPALNFAVDHAVDIKAGDHVIMSAWIKTSGTPSSTAQRGVFLGIDPYDSTWKRIGGASTPQEMQLGVGYPTWNDPNKDSWFVNWGSDWTYKQWDFVVPENFTGDGLSASSYALGVSGIIAHGMIWAMAWNGDGLNIPNTVWVSDFRFYKIT
jgi:hypothetical protein